jgi:peptidoglycan hydrolase-like protein with peptidoglycan-binding domain
VIPAWWSRELIDGEAGDDVLIVQRKLGVPMTGVYDHDTQTRVRGFQKKNGLEETGTMTKKTAAKVGDKASKGSAPEWFERDLSEGDTGLDVSALRIAIGQPNLPDYYDNNLADAVRRFQAEVGIKPTGKADKKTVVALADRRV